MTIDEIKQLIKSDEYLFLKENNHLGNNIVLLTLGGSHAYGTNIETSDVDIRGIAIETPDEIIGLNNFDQFINTDTDTTIYSFNKIIELLYNCNPNIIEILGCKDYLYISELGQKLLDNKNIFLSKKAAYTFGGYAIAQLRKIQNVMYRDRMPEDMRNKHIAQSMNSAIKNFKNMEEKLFKDFHMVVKEMTDPDTGVSSLVCDFNVNNFDLGKLNEVCQEMTAIKRDYSLIGGRNKKKDDEHMCKHMMHLIRLYHMGIEILRDGEINTYRESDHDLLMEIRNGKYMDENGIATDEFFEMVNRLEKELIKARDESSLPDRPNYDVINKFLVTCNKEIISGNYKSNFVEDLAKI